MTVYELIACTAHNTPLQRTMIRHRARRERGGAIMRSRRACYVRVPPSNGTLAGTKMRALVPNVAIIWLGLSLAQPASPCSFAPGFEVFQLGPVLRPTTTLASPPEVSVVRVDRGYDDGDPASCSDAGVLVLKVPSISLGYRFELVEGSFDDTVFPEKFVRPIRGGELRFVWLDGERNWQEEIDVLVKVTSISSVGVVSEPAFLRIRHPGGARAR